MRGPHRSVRRLLGVSGWALIALAAIAGGCGGARSSSSNTDGGLDGGEADAAPVTAAAAETIDPAAPAAPQPGAGSDKPLLGITAFVATVYKEPRDTAKKLGYLRVGALVPRSPEPVGTSGCPAGWYAVEPRGYVCAGDEATTDLTAPILKAAARRPNLKAALPYHYAFVRAVLPMYVRVPTAEDQYKAEFKLKEHLEWYQANEAEVTRVALGAPDVPIDDRGVPIPDKKLGELGLGKNSQETPIGILLGGTTNEDPIPFWLEGGKRAIPNVSDYKIKGFELFADRARRHTGLALIGSFPTGPESLNRRFAVTTDLRLAPASKIKPDMGSPWHGLELDEQHITLPLAFVRSQGATAYKIVKGKVSPAGPVEYRSAVGLTGKQRTVEGVKYYRTTDKRWLSQLDVGLAVPPATWPEDAEKGRKWLEISIVNQTLVLWEGQKPVYATLISSGQAGLDDPKKTTATVRGTFKIRNKHISALMDSNESSSVGGKANSSAVATTSAPERDDDDDKPAKATATADKTKKAAPAKDTKVAKASAKDAKGSAAKAKAAPPAKPTLGPDGKPVIPKKGDGAYGVTRRRGEGTFQLRDVPWIQYFESGYALHAAYWHDVFGTPRSHGCINLSPVDAHRVFLWTDPPVPEGWHGVNSGEEAGEGTTVIVHE